MGMGDVDGQEMGGGRVNEPSNQDETLVETFHVRWRNRRLRVDLSSFGECGIEFRRPRERGESGRRVLVTRLRLSPGAVMALCEAFGGLYGQDAVGAAEKGSYVAEDGRRKNAVKAAMARIAERAKKEAKTGTGEA
jgi:hypothetical protein